MRVWRSTSASVVAGDISAILWKGREQNAAIERIEMHVALQIEIGSGSGFSAVVRRVGAEEIFGAAAQARHVPGKPVTASIAPATPFAKSLRERNHVSECLRR